MHIIDTQVISWVESSQSDNRISFAEIYSWLFDLNYGYPGFEWWFWEKVVRGVESGSRSIISMRNRDAIIGLAIVKYELEEHKICTLRVHPSFRGKGMGSRLLEKSCRMLGTDKPLITVSRDNLKYFEAIFAKYRFELCQKLNGYYRKDSIEYVFNGNLLKVAHVQKGNYEQNLVRY